MDAQWKDFLELHEHMEAVFKALILDPRREDYGNVYRKSGVSSRLVT